MLEKLGKMFRDLRIGVAFIGYEGKCRVEHSKKAEIDFSTRELEREIQSLESQIRAEASKLYAQKIAATLLATPKKATAVSAARRCLELFSRDYSKELDELHKTKSALYAEKDMAHGQVKELAALLLIGKVRLREAYVPVHEHQQSIDAWHAKSKRTPWLFGNGGKKLPKRAIFGQSMGDLESLKYHRDQAYREVQKIKQDIDKLEQRKDSAGSRILEIKSQIAACKEETRSVHEAKLWMKELMDAGGNKEASEAQLAQCEADLRKEQEQLKEYERARDGYIVSKQHAYGVIERRQRVASIQSLSREFIRDFDREADRALRRAEHRKVWLCQRGLEDS